MNNNKKPSEPAEEERWVKIEKEVQELKRSRSILSIGLFLLSGLYGILILCIILRIIRIEDTLTSIIQFNALVGEHLQNKKPSEPAEEERWVKIEKEVQELKRSRSILSIGLFLLSGLYGILILCIILRIIRIEDTLTSIIQFNALVGEHLQSLGDSLIRILNDFEMLLRALSEVF